MSRETFGTTPSGQMIEVVTLKSPALTARVLTLGATVQDLRLAGVDHPLVLGFNRPEPYFDAGLYVGALVGRLANRLAGGRFTLDGHSHQADRNEGGRTLLHGGSDGIHHHIWQITALETDRVVMELSLPDGHMGFPGKLAIRAAITLRDTALCFDLSAQSDAPTLCNLAHHGYFTLDGGTSTSAHRLEVAAEAYLPVDSDLIPTGEVKPVAGTDFDFRRPRALGTGSYDHNLCLSDTRVALRRVAMLTGESGLRMEVETTEPGLQVYDGRHFDGVAGLEGRIYGPHAGVALETQVWPDAPNHPDFPEATLRPGQTYHAVTNYRFLRPEPAAKG